jgi:hypothetical protein
MICKKNKLNVNFIKFKIKRNFIKNKKSCTAPLNGARFIKYCTVSRWNAVLTKPLYSLSQNIAK